MLTPSSLTIAQGASGSTVVTTVLVSGPTQPLKFELGAMPLGVSWRLAPEAPLIGMPAVLTLDVGTVVPGTYIVPVVASSPQGVVHKADLTFTITAADFSI